MGWLFGGYMNIFTYKNMHELTLIVYVHFNSNLLEFQVIFKSILHLDSFKQIILCLWNQI